MASRISQEAEDKIFNGLVKVTGLINEGAGPNDAIVKVAKADGLTAFHVRLMANAFNTGRTNRQRTSAADFFDKSAEFELADAAAILEAIYPKHVKTAEERSRPAVVSEEYDAPPDWARTRTFAEKAARATELTYDEPPAADYGRDPLRFEKRALGALDRLRREREALYGRLQESYDKVASAFGDLCLYFREPGATPVEDVLANAAAFYGRPAEAVLEKAADQSSCCMTSKPVKVRKPKTTTTRTATMTIKRSSAPPPMDRRRAPYLQLEEVLRASAEHGELFDKLAAFEQEAVAAELRLGRAAAGEAASLEADVTLSLMRRLRGEKRAFGPLAGTVGSGLGFAVGSNAGNSIMSRLMPKSDDKVKQDAYMDLMDPSHESRLRAVRTKATLHGLLNSPYFEGEDPHNVTDLFNKVTKLSPRMADQPILLESAMRRLMSQGSADPHDLDQLLGIEIKQKQRDQLPGGNPGEVSLVAPGLDRKPEEKKV